MYSPLNLKNIQTEIDHSLTYKEYAGKIARGGVGKRQSIENIETIKMRKKSKGSEKNLELYRKK